MISDQTLLTYFSCLYVWMLLGNPTFFIYISNLLTIWLTYKVSCLTRFSRSRRLRHFKQFTTLLTYLLTYLPNHYWMRSSRVEWLEYILAVIAFNCSTVSRRRISQLNFSTCLMSIPIWWLHAESLIASNVPRTHPTTIGDRALPSLPHATGKVDHCHLQCRHCRRLASAIWTLNSLHSLTQLLITQNVVTIVSNIEVTIRRQCWTEKPQNWKFQNY